MTLEKMTRDILRNITIGKTEIYVLPSAKHCESARVMCSYLGSYEGLKFTTSIDIPNHTIAITRTK